MLREEKTTERMGRKKGERKASRLEDEIQNCKHEQTFK
jgi:hypothetical protein